MNSSIRSDQSLVALVREGDEQAATALYERYSARIYGLVKSKMSDQLQLRLTPEDIVQSVFKSIFRGVAAGGYDAPEGGTLWQLMAVVAVHKVRRNGNRLSAKKRDAARTEPLADYENQLAISPATVEEFEVAIREAMECLKPEEREVALLRVQGFSVEEISQKTDRSRRSVERLLQSTRSKLSCLLDTDDLESREPTLLECSLPENERVVEG
ncbi:MAG: sigma-70 family RNA polymerase sigma factor [Pirellula sp.]|nr:sigma-70 family RNA polymerase sigma factor [Pirellula sp.]